MAFEGTPLRRLAGEFNKAALDESVDAQLLMPMPWGRFLAGSDPIGRTSTAWMTLRHRLAMKVKKSFSRLAGSATVYSYLHKFMSMCGQNTKSLHDFCLKLADLYGRSR